MRKSDPRMRVPARIRGGGKAVRAYLSLGSNLGDRISFLAQAIRALAEAGRRPLAEGKPALTVHDVSPVYETAPIGEGGALLLHQPPFLNCAVSVNASLSAPALRWLTVGIETALGRESGARWSPRTVDIDLVLFGRERVELPYLKVPHPRMCERAFVLRPLVDLERTLTTPDCGALETRLPLLEAQPCREYLSAAAFRELIGPLPA